MGGTWQADASGGMCEGGRILHFRRHNLWRCGVSVLLTDFMAEGSRSRHLLQGAKTVGFLREEIDVRAGVWTIGGLGAHVGQFGLEELLTASSGRHDASRVLLTHGKGRQRAALSAVLELKPGETQGFELEPWRSSVIELPQLVRRGRGSGRGPAASGRRTCWARSLRAGFAILEVRPGGP